MRLLKPLAAGALALGLLTGAALAVAQSAAETAVAEAIGRLRKALGPGAVVEHGALRVEPIAGRVRLSSLVVMPDGPAGQRFVIGDVVADDLRPGGTGFRRLSLHGTRILQGEAERGRIGSVTIESLTLPAGDAFSLAEITLDSLYVLDLGWALPDGSAVHFAFLSASGIGGDRSDRFEISDLVLLGGRDGGFERLELGLLEIEGVRLLPMVLATLEGRAPPTPRGPSQVTLRELAVRAEGREWLRLGEMTAHAEDAEGPPGTQRSSLAVRQLVVGLPAEMEEALDGVRELRLAITAEGVSNQERGDYELDSLRVEAEGLGALELGLRVSGATVPPFGDPLMNGRLHAFRLAFEDGGLVARALAGAARRSGLSEAEMRRQLLDSLAGIEAMLGAAPAPGPEPKGGSAPALPDSKRGPAGRAPVAGAGALRAFLERPGRLTISARPTDPLPFSELADAADTAAAQALIARLGLRVQAE